MGPSLICNTLGAETNTRKQKCLVASGKSGVFVSRKEEKIKSPLTEGHGDEIMVCLNVVLCPTAIAWCAPPRGPSAVSLQYSMWFKTNSFRRGRPNCNDTKIHSLYVGKHVLRSRIRPLMECQLSSLSSVSRSSLSFTSTSIIGTPISCNRTQRVLPSPFFLS